jgi:hypothetical protein
VILNGPGTNPLKTDDRDVVERIVRYTARGRDESLLCVTVESAIAADAASRDDMR